MTLQEEINSLSPNITRYEPLTTLPGNWEVTGTRDNWDLRFPDATFTNDTKMLWILGGLGLVAIFMAGR